MPKNIVVFSDGTGQEGGAGNDTNVYKLFNAVLDRSPEQIAFYDRGLGTGGRKLLGMATGMGISRNICECYQFVFEHFEAQDQLYLFGFSRGATTVRSLSGFLHLFGILPKSRPELIRRAWRIYRINDRVRREALARDFVERHSVMWCKVHFLGVWDTVAALGLPLAGLGALLNSIPAFRHRYHDLRMSKSVVHGRHALAIDDERTTFHPTLWDPELAEGQTMKQVWFSGMHTDVGGGYAEHALSDIALSWMLREAESVGLRLYEKSRAKLDARMTPDPDGFMHDSRGKGLARIYRRKVRSWPVATHGKPAVHASVKARRVGRDNQSATPYRPWILELEHDVEP